MADSEAHRRRPPSYLRDKAGLKIETISHFYITIGFPDETVIKFSLHKRNSSLIKNTDKIHTDKYSKIQQNAEICD